MTITHVEVLVEEASMERVLRHLLPRLLGDRSFEIRTFHGKSDLLKKLPVRLMGYASWLGEQARVVVVVDRDDDDCLELKRKMNEAATAAGLTVCSLAAARPGQVLNRIAVEELEAWFFGDISAMRVKHPRLPATLSDKQGYRDPDAMVKTWERLEKLMQDAGYHQGGLAKTKLADDVAPHLSLATNRSASFHALVSGVRYLVEGVA